MAFRPLIRVVELRAEEGERWGFDLATVMTQDAALHPSLQYFQAIVPGTPAYRAQLLPNDYVLKIAGLDVSQMKHEAVVDLVKKETSPTLAVTVQSSAMEHFMQPHKMFKIRSGQALPRTYWLSDDGSRIFWKSRQKDKHEAVYRMGDIKDVRLGRQTLSFQRAYDEASDKTRLLMGGEAETGCFSVSYGQDYEVVDFVAPNFFCYTIWTLCLQHATEMGKDLIEEDSQGRAYARNQWLREIFDEGDVNSDRELTLTEARHLMKKLNFHIDNSTLKRKFYEADVDKSGSSGYHKLDFDEFKRFYKLVATRRDIGEVMLKYGDAAVDRSKTHGKFDTFDDVEMSVEQLKLFLEIEQGEPGVTEAICKSLIEEFEPISDRRARTILGIDGFSRMMLSRFGDAFNPLHIRQVYQDMDQPLSHYYIASSHNTYLTEDQLRGPSDADMYMRALMMGCRCVELDCWDGSNGDPVIYHGYTLTSKITFRDVVRIINDYAFKVSDFPVIISLENHCSIAQQKKMAEYLKTILGDSLYTEFDAGRRELPAPADLRRKFLIKGKKLADTAGDDGEVSDEDEADEVIADESALKGQSRIVKKQMKATMERRKQLPRSKKKKKHKLAKELSDLVTYVKSVHFHGFEHDAELLPAHEMSSFGENKARGLALDRTSGRQFVERNKRQLARTYPAGVRVQSTNYEPHELWNAGCQLVALNYQTHSHEMCVNQGKFRDNGGCGYVLKPEPLRTFGIPFDPNDPSSMPVIDGKVLSITVLSGQHLPKPKGAAKGEVVDPYVRVELVGVPADSAKAQTSVVVNNGFNPNWNETVEFDVRMPDLALVHFKVYDQDTLSGDDFIAQCVIPFHSLRPGYRHVELRTKADYQMPNVGLFVQTAILPGGSRSLRKGTRGAMKVIDGVDQKVLMRPLKFQKLENTYRSAPLQRAGQLRDALLLGLERFKTALGLPAVAAFDVSLNQLQKHIAEHDGTLIAEETMAGHVATFTLATNRLAAGAVSLPQISRPLQHYANIRHACEEILTAYESLSQKLREAMLLFDDYASESAFAKLCATAHIGKKKARAKQRAAFDAKLNDLRRHVSELDSGRAVVLEVNASVKRIVVEQREPLRRSPKKAGAIMVEQQDQKAVVRDGSKASMTLDSVDDEDLEEV